MKMMGRATLVKVLAAGRAVYKLCPVLVGRGQATTEYVVASCAGRTEVLIFPSDRDGRFCPEEVGGSYEESEGADGALRDMGYLAGLPT